MKKLHKYLINALMLSGVAFVMKTAAVIFQVYIANQVGAEALGLHGLFSGVYGFAITFATSGVHLAATRLTAEALGARGGEVDIRRGMRKCFWYSFSFGLTASVGLYLLTPVLASCLLDEPRVGVSLRILSFALLPIALSSAMNGYFTACRRVYKNAVSQVFEQIVRISATVILLGSLWKDTDPAHACVILVLGSTASEIASFALSALFYLFDRRRYPADRSRAADHRFTRQLCQIALPVAFSSYIRSGLLALEHALIPQGLRKSGSSRTEALEAYGILNSMVFPIILFPTAIISSFSGLLIPELAECRAQKNQKEISYIAARVYSLALWFSIGVSAVLCCFAEEFGMVIYGNVQAAKYIRLLAPLIPVMYLDTTTDAMLKGLGQQVYSMVINIADALISVILVWILLPQQGIDGYILTVYIAEIFNAVCSITRLLSISHMQVRVTKWVFKPLLCAVGSTTIAYLLARLPLISALSATPRLCVHVLSAAIAYMMLLCGIRAVDTEEYQWIRSIFTAKSADDGEKASPHRSVRGCQGTIISHQKE